MKPKTALNLMKKFGTVTLYRKEPFKTSREYGFGSMPSIDPDWKARFSCTKGKLVIDIEVEGHNCDQAIQTLYEKFTRVQFFFPTRAA